MNPLVPLPNFAMKFNWERAQGQIISYANSVNASARKRDYKRNTEMFQMLEQVLDKAYQAGKVVSTYTSQEDGPLEYVRVNALYFGGTEVPIS